VRGRALVAMLVICLLLALQGQLMWNVESHARASCNGGPDRAYIGMFGSICRGVAVRSHVGFGLLVAGLMGICVTCIAARWRIRKPPAGSMRVPIGWVPQ